MSADDPAKGLLRDEAATIEIPPDLSIRVNADLFRIAYTCASKEDVRYFLSGVYIEPHPAGGAILTATDGHRMVSIHDVDGEASTGAIVSVTKEFLGLCKSGAEIPRQLHVFGPDATVKEGGTPIGFAANCIVPGAFPDWRKVVPDYDEGAAAGPFLSFDGPRLEAFSKIGVALAKVRKIGSAAMRVVTKDPMGGALILWPMLPHAFGILMPLETDDLRVPPKFFAEAGPGEARPAAPAADAPPAA